MKIPLLNKDISVIILEIELIGKLGSYKLDMALDTGATFTMIPWNVAERLGYDPTQSREKITITTASAIEKVPLITLAQIRIFGMKIPDIKVAVHNLPPKSRVDGLLGLSFLKYFDIKLYLKSGFLEFKA